MSSLRARPAASLLVLSCALVFCACGGGGGGGDEDGAITLNIESTAALDGGIVRSANGVVNEANSGSVPLVGDGAFAASGGTLTYTGLWSFDLSELPAGAQIQSATLQLQVLSVAGDPAAAFALARIDHCNFGAVFPTTDSVNVVEFNFATISDLNTTGPKPVDATAQVEADLTADRTRSQFRMRMAITSDNDAEADWCVMTDFESVLDPALRPQLIVVYTTP